jgi:hypothetical protein
MALPIDLRYNKRVHKDTLAKVKDIAEKYGLEEVPDHVKKALDVILESEHPNIKADGVLMKMETICSALWADGKVTGPDTPESLERRATQADNLVKMFEKKEDADGAKKQRARAASLRAQAAAMLVQEKKPKDKVAERQLTTRAQELLDHGCACGNKVIMEVDGVVFCGRCDRPQTAQWG